MQSLANFQVPEGGTSVALGFFDGFHRGHQAIVKAACDTPLFPIAFTFRNHPAGVISSQRSPALLTLSEERKSLLESAGAQVVWCDFDRPFSQLSAQEFFGDILVGRLGARRLVSGANYRFGHKAAGDVGTLRELAGPHGIEVVTLDGVQEAGEWISSTRVRQAVKDGDMDAVLRMLGRHYALEARVLRGDQRGRTLGFPTANLPLPEGKAVPAYGVYACQVRRGGQSHPAVANLGIRPTITSSGEPVLEVHLLDFEGDLYGEKLHVELCAFLRPEQRFSGLDALREQIGKDCLAARQRLFRPA